MRLLTDRSPAVDIKAIADPLSFPEIVRLQQLATAGKAETKIKYKFENIDTSGYDDIEDFINQLAEIRKGGGKLNGKEVVAADLEALELLIKTYQEAEEKQKQLIDEFRQFLTATTETQIADAVVAGLQAGKSSAADFADDFETMMRNAVVNSLKAEIMDAKLADFYKKMNEYALSDGIISKDVQADLKLTGTESLPGRSSWPIQSSRSPVWISRVLRLI